MRGFVGRFVLLFLCGSVGVSYGETLESVGFQELRGGEYWQSRGGGRGVLIGRDEFWLEGRDNSLVRLEWRLPAPIQTMQADSLWPSRQYRFGAGGTQRLRGAERVKAIGEGIFVSYYFGVKGLKFDIHVEPGVDAASIALEVPGAKLNVDTMGRLCISGEPMILKPVAYTAGKAGKKTPVLSAFRLVGQSRVEFALGNYNKAERLVIDPVLTYGSYFGGTGLSTAVALRTLADGTLLLAGNTQSFDIAGAKWVATGEPVTREAVQQSECFVAGIAPLDKRVRFVSYLGGSGRDECTSMDIDQEGRILLAGWTDDTGTFPTTPKDVPAMSSEATRGSFLARISALGDALEYSTLLPPSGHLWRQGPFIRAGAGETVHVGLSGTPGALQLPRPDAAVLRDAPAGGADVLLLHYDIAQRRSTRHTYFGGNDEDALAGVAVSQGGSVYIWGWTTSVDFPVQDPVQDERPPGTRRTGFVAAVAANYDRLVFSTPVGGVEGSVTVDLLAESPDGGLRVAGTASPGAIPGFPMDDLPRFANAIYSAEIRPGESGLARQFHRHVSGFDSKLHAGYFQADGRYCLVFDGPPSWAHPTSAVFGPALSGIVPLAGCFFNEGAVVQMLTELSFRTSDSVVAAPSETGAWAAMQTNGGIPPDVLTQGLTPRRQSLAVLHVDFEPKAPQLTSPPALRFPSTRRISGRNFTRRQVLEVGGQQIPVTGLSSTTALVGTVTPGLPPGTYSGQLSTADPPDLKSDPFEVVSEYLPPASEPAVLAVAGGPVFTMRIKSPVYAETEIFWQGAAVEKRFDAETGRLEIDLPAGVGELLVRNPSPGGGTVRQTLLLGEPGYGITEPIVIRRVLEPVVAGGSFSQVPFRGAFGFGECSARWDGEVRRAICSLATATVIFTPDDLGRFGKHRLQLIGTGWQTPEQDAWVGVGGNITEAGHFDTAGQIYYEVLGGSGGQVRAMNLTTGELRSAPLSLRANVPAWTVSADGQYLHVADPAARTVHRLRTDALERDIEFAIPGEGTVTRLRVQRVEDSAEAVVVSTEDDIYFFDGGTVREYTAAAFPLVTTERMPTPFLATTRYLYARGGTDDPCLIRYPLDESGFGVAEEICTPGAVWETHEEQRRVGPYLLLVEGGVTERVLEWTAAGAGPSEAAGLPIPAQDVLLQNSATVDSWRLDVIRLSTGRPIAHYPRGRQLIATPLALLPDNLLLVKIPRGSVADAVVVPVRWREDTEQYPE